MIPSVEPYDASRCPVCGKYFPFSEIVAHEEADSKRIEESIGPPLFGEEYHLLQREMYRRRVEAEEDYKRRKQALGQPIDRVLMGWAIEQRKAVREIHEKMAAIAWGVMSSTVKGAIRDKERQRAQEEWLQ